jgi:hypothetical protein
MRRLLFFAIVLLTAACDSPSIQPSADGAGYRVPEDSAIAKAVKDAYAVISFKRGAKPSYDSIKYCFIPQAQLINFRTDTEQVTSIDQFVDFYRQFIEGNHIVMFEEEEIAGRTEQFGKIAHRISTYKTYFNSMDSLPERGVNSFQLIKTPVGWKVSSIIWDVERPSLPIPGYYLAADSAKKNP